MSTEVKTKLTVDSSQFNAAIAGADSKLARFASGLSGMGGGFRLFGAVSEALNASGKSASGFVTSLAGVAAIAGPLAIIAGLLKGMAASAASSAESFDSFGRGGQNKGIFGSEWLDKYERLMWLFTPKWAGGDFFMPLPNRDVLEGRKRTNQMDAINRAKAGINGQSAEQRVLEWMNKEKVGYRESNRIKDRLMMEQGVDDWQKQREQIMGAGSRSLGLNIGLGNGVGDYFRSVADNTLETVNLLTQVRDNLIAGGAPARAG